MGGEIMVHERPLPVKRLSQTTQRCQHVAYPAAMKALLSEVLGYAMHFTTVRLGYLEMNILFFNHITAASNTICDVF